MPRKLLLTNIGWIATPEPVGEDQRLYRILHPDADALLIVGERIEWIGKLSELSPQDDIDQLDLKGQGITPGLVDFHAHPVFAGTRESEFQLRTAGASYAEIAASGGGILNSAKRVASASPDDLASFARPFLDNALRHGTTTLEAKSGYGLSVEGELKLLEVIRTLDREHHLDLIPTFLGAHDYPEPYRQDHEAYIRLVIEEMIPRVAREKLAVACDIFCETGVFSIDESRRILRAAQEHGLAVKVHADQLTPLGGAKLAAELGALSADHIEFLDEDGIEALAESGTVAGLLPVAAHFLRMKEDPPVRKLIERGVVCALATDFNPGSAMCENMQMAIHLAAIRFRVSAAEALWMATAGSARGLGLSDRGYLAPGGLADIAVWNCDSIEMIPYHFGINQVSCVVKRGSPVVLEGRHMG